MNGRGMAWRRPGFGTRALVAFALTAASSMVLLAPSTVASAMGPPRVKTQSVCATPKAGYRACMAERVVKATANGGVTTNATTSPTGFGPTDLQSAYKLPSSTAGAGKTVAIVDAYDLPTAEADLANYRSTYGLPACTSASGCFKKVGQTGTATLPAANADWGEEIALDIDMVSAACPLCHILLVEAKSASNANLGIAVNTAVSLGANAVSNSYGGSESSSDTSYDSSYYKHPGVAITASSGDDAYGTEYPAASPWVTAVGGTSLTRASTTTRGWTETAWNDAGSGCTTTEAKPTFQTDTGCAKRTIADVSAVADPATGVSVYDSYGSGAGWNVYGGTSVSSPLIASTFALATSPTSSAYPNSYPYATRTALNDVTSGSNGTCSPTYLCTAGAGYDGPTGLGTPNGVAAFGPASTTPPNDFSVAASPTSVSVNAGSSGTSSISTATTSGSAQTLSFSASGLPSGVTASFSPTSVTSGSSSTLTLTASPTAASSTSTVTVTATGASGSHTTTLSLTVVGAAPANDFSVAASPTSVSVNAGSSGTSSISTATTSGSAQSLSLSASGLPSGVTASFSPASVTSGGSSTLTLTASPTAAASTSTVTITATGASGSHTATVSVTVVPAAGTCTAVQKVANSGFESGATSWTSTSGVIGQYGTTQPAHAGTWDAWMDGYGSTHTDSISQSIAIPAGCTTYTLSFWLHITTAETTTTTQYDKLNVTLGSTTLATYSNLNKSSGYVQKTFNVSGFAGQTVTLKFTGTEDSSLQTSFVVDDCTLNAS